MKPSGLYRLAFFGLHLMAFGLLLRTYSLPSVQTVYLLNDSLSNAAFKPFADLLGVPSTILIYFALAIIGIVSIIILFMSRLQPASLSTISFIGFYLVREFLLWASNSRIDSLQSLAILSILFLFLLVLPSFRANTLFLFVRLCDFTFLLALLFSSFILLTFSNLPIFYWNDRFNGIFQHPQFAGVFFGLSAIFYISLVFSRSPIESLTLFRFLKYSGNYFPRLFLLFLSLLSFFLLLCTGSRTGVISFVAAFVLILLRYFNKSSIAYIMLSSLIVIGSVILVSNYFDSFTDVLLPFSSPSLRSFDFSSNSGRSEIWSSHFNLFLANPIFGSNTLGLGTESSYLNALSFGGLFLFVPMIFCVYFLFLRAPQLMVFSSTYHFKRVSYFLVPVSSMCLFFFVSFFSEGILFFDRFTPAFLLIYFLAIVLSCPFEKSPVPII